jgi:peptidoglycan-N-acetylglucosamine deacetylase
MKIIKILFAFLIFNIFLCAQVKSVAITMDDLFSAFNDMDIRNIEVENDSLLNSISRLSIPVTVFVNEKSIIKIGETDERLILYNKWVDNPFITIGNHTYSHKNYASTGLEMFEEDIIQGETITKELLKKANKNLKYFRFPFNCTGKDSADKAEIFQFLDHKGYRITPFTVESSDYMYNALYCNYLKKGNKSEANKLIEEYIDFTLNLFQYFEGVTNELYGRNIRHIFLCHTNPLNAACFEKLILRLKENGYSFISLDEALEDKIYQSKDYYSDKYGISWIYRWIGNIEERKKLMRKEPYSEEIEQQYNSL